MSEPTDDDIDANLRLEGFNPDECYPEYSHADLRTAYRAGWADAAILSDAEPTEAEIEAAGQAIAPHEYRVNAPYWVAYCTCGWRAEGPYDVDAYDQHIARGAIAAFQQARQGD